MCTTCLLKKPAHLRWAPSMLSFGGGEEEAWLSFQGPMEALSGLLGGICPWIHSSILVLLLPVEVILFPLSSSLLSSLSLIASVGNMAYFFLTSVCITGLCFSPGLSMYLISLSPPFLVSSPSRN